MAIGTAWAEGSWVDASWVVGAWDQAVSPPVFSGTIPDISLTESATTTDYDLSTYFTGAVSYAIAPAVESGWTFNTTTGLLTVLPDTVGSFGPYIVTATNTGGSTPSNSFGVAVTAVEIEPQREPVEGGGGWPGHGIYKKKRREKAILQDDEDLMRIIQEALPAILKFLRRD